MKILFTGMSSSHVKESKNQSFFKTLSKVYGELGEVTWAKPSLSWSRSDLEAFDQIVFGFSPPTSLGANYLYGALHVLNLMYESPKLRIVVDSPQMWQYKNSVKAFKRDPDQIFGSFYERRQNFKEAKDGKIRSEVEQLAQKMGTVDWPITYTPLLPWSDQKSVAAKIPFINEDSVVSLNLDSFLLEDQTPEIGRKEQWGVDNVKSPWWKVVSQTTSVPSVSIKNSKKPKDSEVEERIKMSMGLAVSPQDRKLGTWWSYRYIQGMNTTTPIATYWQDTFGFSDNWSYLAYQIEDMQPYERQHIAFQQKREYKEAIPNKTSATLKVKNLMLDLQTRGN